jgi:hypothetical protein
MGTARVVVAPVMAVAPLLHTTPHPQPLRQQVWRVYVSVYSALFICSFVHSFLVYPQAKLQSSNGGFRAKLVSYDVLL